MAQARKIIAFIDLLGTKESHKVSDSDFKAYLIALPKALAQASRKLPTDGRFEIEQFSDCAILFFALPMKDVCSFLDEVRERLLSAGFYFKCGVARGNQLVDGSKISLNSQESFAQKIYENIETKHAELISKHFNSRVFGPEIMEAFLLHEEFKGVGFSIAQELKEDRVTVDSVYLGNKSSDALAKYVDIPFTGIGYQTILNDKSLTTTASEKDDFAHTTHYRKWSKDNENREQIRSLVSDQPISQLPHLDPEHSFCLAMERLVRSIRRAHASNKSYSRYYISILTTAIRSSSFDFIWFDSELERWRAAPPIFSLLIDAHILRRAFRGYPGFYLIEFLILNEILRSIDIRRSIALSDLNDPQRMEIARKFDLPKELLDTRTPSSTNSIPSFLKTNRYAQENLKLLQITEQQAIRQLAGIGQNSRSISLSDIPDSVLPATYKRRVKEEYALAGTQR